MDIHISETDMDMNPKYMPEAQGQDLARTSFSSVAGCQYTAFFWIACLWLFLVPVSSSSLLRLPGYT